MRQVVAPVVGVLTAARQALGSRGVAVLTRAAIGLFAGWVSVAFFLNVATALVDALAWQLGVLLVAALTLLVLTAAAWGALAYAAAGCWALVGVAVTGASDGTIRPSAVGPLPITAEGAAKIDGTPGVDLVVGFLSGPHTLLFRVLRFGGGRLQMVDAPGRGRWVIDGSFTFNIGQFRSIRNGKVFMTKRSAVRDLDGTGHHGRDTRFRWSRLRWVKVSSVRRTYARDRAASRVGGWHVRGLPRFLP